jgi:hypothetical protein
MTDVSSLVESARRRGLRSISATSSAALRLMIRSTFVDCWTGRSAGFSPRPTSSSMANPAGPKQLVRLAWLPYTRRGLHWASLLSEAHDRQAQRCGGRSPRLLVARTAGARSCVRTANNDRFVVRAAHVNENQGIGLLGQHASSHYGVGPVEVVVGQSSVLRFTSLTSQVSGSIAATVIRPSGAAG